MRYVILELEVREGDRVGGRMEERERRGYGREGGRSGFQALPLCLVLQVELSHSEAIANGDGGGDVEGGGSGLRVGHESTIRKSGGAVGRREGEEEKGGGGKGEVGRVVCMRAGASYGPPSRAWSWGVLEEKCWEIRCGDRAIRNGWPKAGGQEGYGAGRSGVGV